MITHDELMEEIKKNDPQLYKEIKEESAREIEELKKWGGKRPNSGRKKLNKEKVKKTFELEQTDVVCLKEYAKKHKISQNKAIKEAINNLTKKEA